MAERSTLTVSTVASSPRKKLTLANGDEQLLTVGDLVVQFPNGSTCDVGNGEKDDSKYLLDPVFFRVQY